MKRTDIEWTANILPDGTLEPGLSANPLKYRDRATGAVVWGCVKKSAGCANCYAESIANHYDRGGPFTRAQMDKLEPFLDAADLRHILTAKKVGGHTVAGSRCFLGDMTDVFGEWVPNALLDRLFAVMALRSDVTFQVLTKRPERMRDYFDDDDTSERIAQAVIELDPKAWSEHRAGLFDTGRDEDGKIDGFAVELPLPNVWLGTSVENQAAADARIPHLLQVPAVVRFLSCEPLLGPVDLGRWFYRWDTDGFVGPIDWVIVGGESGPNSRAMQVSWATSLVEQCKAAGVACFVKQLGANPTEYADHDTTANGGIVSFNPLKLKSRKGSDPDEWPEALRVREFPEVRS